MEEDLEWDPKDTVLGFGMFREAFHTYFRGLRVSNSTSFLSGSTTGTL